MEERLQRNRANTLATGFVLLLAGLLGSCESRPKITQYPAFYTPDLRDIAVIPFRDQTQNKDAGEFIADHVASGIAATRTYRIHGRNDLKNLLEGADLQAALAGDAAATAQAFRRIGNIQAVLTGAVNTFSTSTRVEQRQEALAVSNDGPPRAAGDAQRAPGGAMREYTRVEATVSVTARLIRVSDGATIYATPTPAECTESQEGSPPSRDSAACLSAATEKVARQIVEEFSVVERDVAIDTQKACRLASDFSDNKWNFTNDFNIVSSKLFAVILLPANCDRNPFKLAIVRKGTGRELATADFIWNAADSSGKGRGFEFGVKEIAAQGGGAGEYTLKLCSGAQLVCQKEFRILE